MYGIPKLSQVINKDYGCMTSNNTLGSIADSVKETDSYILLPEIEQQGKNMFAQKSVVEAINKAFMKICLTAGEIVTLSHFLHHV